VTAFRAVVIEHFRHPRNRRRLDGATHSMDGANPLCGDRIRIELRVADGVVADAAFTADACALCIASASLLTTRVCGEAAAVAVQLDVGVVHALLEGTPPPARAKCAALPLDTLQRALASGATRPGS
jgi:nitrogen fixation NifU-like protein